MLAYIICGVLSLISLAYQVEAIKYRFYSSCDPRWKNFEFTFIYYPTCTRNFCMMGAILKKGQMCSNTFYGTRFTAYSMIASTFNKPCNGANPCTPVEFYSSYRRSNKRDPEEYLQTLGFKADGEVGIDSKKVNLALLGGRILVGLIQSDKHYVLLNEIVEDKVAVQDPYKPDTKSYSLSEFKRIFSYILDTNIS